MTATASEGASAPRLRAPAVTTELPLPAAEAFHFLENPSSLQYLVAGARKIRRFDADWPAVGSRIHHTVGVGPLALRDDTVVKACEHPGRLELEAHIRPFGSLVVEMTLHDAGGRSTLEVREAPVGGLVAAPGLRRLTQVAVKLRNLEIARRFRLLARRRRDVLDERAGARSGAGPEPGGKA